MPAITKHIDRSFLFTTLLLVIIGFFIFSSASLGLLSRDGVRFSSVAVSQLVYGIGGGMLALLLCANVSYRLYRKFAPHAFVAGLLLTSFVFIPGLGYEANGAQRWLLIFGMSVQPSEILKITFVLFIAWYYSMYYTKIGDVRFSLGGLLGALALVGSILLFQPDTGTFLIIGSAGVAMTYAAGVQYKHLAMLGAFCIVGILVLALSRPYLLDRVKTFMDPQSDPSGSGYQLKQSLIAVGSGGWFGRGFGQSVQKFTYLPEPISDSIFSVAAEEFGFLGSVVIVGLFLFFAVRGLHIATYAPDRFGGLVVIGIVILIVTQSFINIASMIGLMPLTGEPLTFISHGGTSLFFALAGVGIILNISRHTTGRLKHI